jgi:Arc/MetJ-type ribon-helix-helix transcriptional regulator
MQDRKDISVCMPGELDAAIKDHLSYGDSKSEWIREAIRQRLSQDDADAGPDTALEAHSSDSEPSESDSDSESVLVSPDEQSTGGGLMQRPK